jgi:hypothetical protein
VRSTAAGVGPGAASLGGVTSPDGDRLWTASDWLVLIWLVVAPVAGIWLVVGGRARVWPVVVGGLLLLAWAALLAAARASTRRRRAVPAVSGVAAHAEAPAASGHTPIAAGGPAEQRTGRGDPRLATMLAIRAAALAHGHREGVDFVVEGVPSSLDHEPVQVRWKGDLLELGFSERGSYRPLARVTTAREMQRVLLAHLAPRRPRDPDESPDDLVARFHRRSRAYALLESDPTAVVVPDEL